jgi:hypothetical protein
MNNKMQEDKNLKHGYIFLTLLILVPFFIAFGIEMHLTGGLKFLTEGGNETPSSYPVDEPSETPESNDEKPKLEIKNIQDGFKTKDTNITLVALTEKDNEAFVNGNKVTVAGDGMFEQKIDLNEGENKIEVRVKNGKSLENSITISVHREVEKKPEPEPTPQPNPTPENPALQPQPTPTPQPPAPEPTPQPPAPTPISGLKLQCSITNTAPFTGESVTVNCTVRDQNNNPVSGAFGYVTMSWKTGSSVYTLSQSNGGGGMSVSFTVPAGNTGANSGNVQVSKDGLNVSSNFNLNVQ